MAAISFVQEALQPQHVWVLLVGVVLAAFSALVLDYAWMLNMRRKMVSQQARIYRRC
jgi:hypothetical protein